MSEPHVEKQPPVPPFVQFCCAAVPMVFDDSLSYYEAVCALWKYVDGMTKVINNNALITEDFIAKVNELHEYVEHYFDNLDVQEEINNKLDAMVEDGTLQTILGEYLQTSVTLTYDTVADMKADTLMVAGSYVRTLGYHTANDGGGALYRISDSGTANEIDIIAVGDGLIATLQVGSTLNVKQYGAYGDNSHGDNVALRRAFENTECSTIYFPAGIYLCGTLTLTHAADIIGEESTLTNTVNDDPILNIAIDGEYRNHFIKNLRFINNGTGNCVECNTTSSFITSRFENCFFHAASGWGLKTNEWFSHSLVECCTFSKNGIYLECGDANTVRKCMFYGIGTGIFLKPTDFGMLNNTIENNTIVNQGYAIHVDRGDQVIIRNNQIEYGGNYNNTNNPNCSIFIDGQYQTCHNIIIDENNFGGGTHLTSSIVIYSGKHCKITRNRFCSTNEEDIKVFNYYGGSAYNQIKDNIIHSYSFNPKTDVWQPVTVATDYPQSVTNVWLPLTITNSTDKLYYMRDENNVVHFQPVHATFSDSTTTIATLPTGYWPSYSVWTEGAINATSTPFRIGYNGVITVTNAITGANDMTIGRIQAVFGNSNLDA